MLASQDGAALAYVTKNDVVVRKSGGVAATLAGAGGMDFRFSPDGQALLALRRATQQTPTTKLELIRQPLSGAAPERLAEFLDNVAWIECCHGGVAVLHGRYGAETLSHVSNAGTLTHLADVPKVRRFCAARDASRLVYFLGAELFELDCALPGRAPRSLGRALGNVENAEMRPDGRELGLTTDKAVQLLGSDDKLRTLRQERHVHSIWYSRDGSMLAFGSRRGAYARVGAALHALPGWNKLGALRFKVGGPSLLVSRGDDVLEWRPGTPPKKLATAPKGSTLVAADSFSGGLVLWTSRMRDEFDGAAGF